MDLGEFYGGDGALDRIAVIGSWWKWADLPYMKIPSGLTLKVFWKSEVKRKYFFFKLLQHS